MKKSTIKDSQRNEITGSKKSYKAPQLQKVGNFSDLTLGNAGSRPDNGNNGVGNMGGMN